MSNENNQAYFRRVWFRSRPLSALYFGVLSGVLGVLVDFDHWKCIPKEAWLEAIMAGEYGCRYLHHLLLPVAFYIYILCITFGFGLWVRLVYYATRPIS